MARFQDLPANELLAVLSEGERERAERIKHHEAWRQFVLTRGLLRLMLARYTGCAPSGFDIVEGEGNAPRLADNPWNLSFNVSHSHDWAAIAVGDKPLGIDIERLDRHADCEQIAEVCYHERERELLRAAPQAKVADTFFDIWTRKEACLKATGKGFSADPSRFSTVPFQGPIIVDGEACNEQGWYTQPLSAPAGYKAALASIAPSRGRA